MRTEERKYKWCILIQEKSISLQQTSRVLPMKEINRLKVVPVEQKRTDKWLAETSGKNEAAISRRCTNETQPSLDTLLEIAKVLSGYYGITCFFKRG
jgi:hypothetical protein